MSNTPINFEPLPSYADPRSVLKGALEALRPAEKITITDAAERSMMVNIAGQWKKFRRDVTPYMTEPTDNVASRKYKGLIFCGPSQSGKTQNLIQAPLVHTITADGGRTAIFQMTKEAAADFELNKLSPMVRNSPDLLERKGKGRGADNVHQKIYTGGTRLTIDWPTITKLSSSTIRTVLMTDYDHFTVSVGGEGDAYSLGRARTKSYKSRGMVICESSPGAPITNESWKAKTPHDAPPVKYGVLSLYPQGTRGRWYWPCPHCEKSFEPTFKRLHYPKSDDLSEAAQAAEMACPHCGCLFGHDLKRELNAAGDWLHETAAGEIATLDSGLVRNTDMLSYWLDGAAAAFSTWEELVLQFVQAMSQFDKTGDEEALKTAYNTGHGQPYMPRGSIEENEITLQGLKDKSNGISIKKGIAPKWTRYVIVSVDTQKTSFVVSATAFGERGKHQVIDRYELIVPPSTSPDPDDRGLKPFEIAEDWAILDELSGTVYPVEGTDYGLVPAILGVDMQGGMTTTENAYKFYRGRRKAGQSKLWHLTRGSGGKHTDRIWMKAPERANKGRKAATDILILNIATDRLKDAVSASLLMEEAAENYFVVPEWMTDTELTEYTAERRYAKGWDKKPGMVRNESFDLLVYARALNIRLGGEKINWDKPKSWAIGGPKNKNAVMLDVTADPEAKILVRKPTVSRRRSSKMRY